MNKVVKLAQPGYDVNTAGDQNLIYNSNWPLLKIYKTGSFSTDSLGSLGDAAAQIATHDLGYVPAFWIFDNRAIESWNSTHTTTAGNRSEFGGFVVGLVPRMYNDRFEVSPSLAPFNKFISLRYYIFALDITKAYQAPSVNVGSAVSGSGGGAVFKLAKPGKDVNSTNLEDYTIHSDARSPLIHSVNPGTASEDLGGGIKGFTAYHNLGYSPMFFMYQYDATTGGWHITNTGTGGSTKIIADYQKVQYQTANANDMVSFVILKDPFLIDYSISVSV